MECSRAATTLILGRAGLGLRSAFRLQSQLREAYIRGLSSCRESSHHSPFPYRRPSFSERWSFPPKEEEGPPDGLTLGQAIELLIQRGVELHTKYLELPQSSRPTSLTAGLRANPILYADSQLVPYGSDSIRKPDGPTQYDFNISHPIDYSHKRQARMAYASRAAQVMEARYQNEVRLAIANLYAAYVDVLTARPRRFAT